MLGALGVSAVGFLCVASLIWTVWLIAEQRHDPMRKRMLDVVSPSGRVDFVEPAPWEALKRGVDTSLRRAMRVLQIKSEARTPGLGTFDRQLALVALLGIAGIATGALMYPFLARRGFSHTTVMIGTVGIVIAVLWMVVRVWLRWHTRRWLEQINNGLINVLDLWVLCLGSGMSFQSALVRVAEEEELTNTALREQLRLTNQEILAGASREDALRHLVHRCGDLPDLRALIAQIIHAERLGGSLAQTLRVYADSLRFKRSQDAKEMIQKLPVKLAVPLVFCILPALLALIVTPAALRLFKALSAQ